jgi:hypothetical protein
MALTALGAALTERHRTQQLALNDALIASVRRLWPAFDPSAIDSSWQRIQPALVALIQARHQDSSAVAAAYFEAFHQAETGRLARPTITLAPTLTDHQVIESLIYTGPITAKKLAARSVTDLAAETLDWTAGNATRLALNGGRETLTTSIAADRKAIGYARVTDGNPCSFCAMIASRGPIFGADSGEFKAHRKCGCTAEPVFSKDPSQPLPGRADEFSTLWTECTKGLNGRKARQAFRRAYEATRT